MDKEHYYKKLRSILSRDKEELSYDCLFSYYSRIASLIKNGNITLYEGQLAEIHNPYLTQEEISAFNNHKINVNSYAAKMTNKAINYYRSKRVKHINVPSDFIKDMDRLVVVRQHEGSFIYRWHPDDENYLAERTKDNVGYDAGEYVNYAEYFKKLIASVISSYPHCEVNLIDKNGCGFGLVSVPNFEYKDIDHNNVIPLHRRLSIKDIVGYDFTGEIVGTKPLRRSEDGMRAGIYVSIDTILDFMSKYKLEIRNYEKETDKPKQKVK